MRDTAVAVLARPYANVPMTAHGRREPTHPQPRMSPAFEPQRRDLTTREIEVLALLCEGLSNKMIQRHLNIGAGTVSCHVGNVLSKLGVSSRLQAVVEAHRRGLLDARTEDNTFGYDEAACEQAGALVQSLMSAERFQRASAG